MINKEKIVSVIDNILSKENDDFEDTEIFLVDVKVSTNNSISVHIDSNDGIKVADCAVLNRKIENMFDREEEDYELLVSSAGIDQPLKVFKQYQKNVGKLVEIQTIEGEKFIGELIKVNNEEIIFKPKVPKKKKKNEELNYERIFKFDHLKQVKVVVTF